MKRLVIIVLGVLALLVVGVVAAPFLIDWNRFKPDIAAAVRDATGRELTLAGDLDVVVLPAIEFSARDVHLSNREGFDEPDMVSIEAVRGRIALWPLITGRVVVEQFLIERPDVTLSVDAAGRTNWRFEPVAAAPKEPDEEETGGSIPIADLRLDDVRIEDGTVTYRDARSGRELSGRDLRLEVSLRELAAPLVVRGRLMLNDQPLTLDASIDPFEAALSGDGGRLALLMESHPLIANLDARVQTEPLFGLDGEASVNVPSVRDLATWLDVPFEDDPGPLKVTARFNADGPKVALEQALVEGDGLSARASASLEVGGDTRYVSASFEGGVLDVDRYLPPPAAFGASPAMPEAEAPAAADGQPLEMLPDSPLDLTWLHDLGADVDVVIEGLKVAGYSTGPIRFTATAADGVVNADLVELALYGGRVGGSVRLDATNESLAARANLLVANVDAAALTRVAAEGGPSIVGIANGRLLAKTQGRTPRELVRNATGELDAGLSSAAGGPAIAGQLSEVSVAFDRPSIDAGPKLRGSAVYGGEDLRFSLDGDQPLTTLLLGDPITIDAALESEVVTASYRGRVLPAPVPSLDGTFDAKVPSVSRLAEWLDQPLGAGGADPGAFEVHAVLQSDGTTGSLQEAWLRGGGLSLEARGEFDASSEVTRFDLAVQGDVLDLGRYLPAGGAEPSATDGGESEAPAAEGEAEANRTADPLAALLDEPIDATVLSAYAGQIEISVAGVRAAGIEAGAIHLVAAIGDGALDLQLDPAEIAAGVASAALAVKDAGDAITVEASAKLDDVRFADLAWALGDSGVGIEGATAAELALTTRGASPRQLAAGASGTLRASLPGLRFEDGPVASASGIDALLELPGGDANPSLEASTSLTSRAEQKSVAVALDGEFGRLAGLLGGAEVPLDLTLRVGEVTLRVSGSIAGLEGALRPDLAIDLEGRRLSDLGLLAGAELPEVSPVSVTAALRTEGHVHRLDDLAVRLGASDLAGAVEIDVRGERPRLVADLHSDFIDVAELTPAEGADAGEPVDAGATDDARVIPDAPLPLEALRALDAEVDLTAARLRTGAQGEIEDLTVRLELTAGRLELAPVAGTAGGTFEIATTVDGAQQPAGFTFDLEADDLIMGTFSDLLQRSGDSVGKIDADIALTGTGNSPRAIAASLDGRANLVGEGGAVESRVLEVLAIGITDVLGPFFGEEENTFLECFVASVDFEAGVGTLREFLVSFPALSIGGSGTIDLRDETLDLKFATDSKNQSLVSFAVPFDVTGPLAAPKVLPDTVGSAKQLAKGAGLAALYLNPITGPAAAAAALGSMAMADTVQGKTDNKCLVAIRNAGSAGEAGQVAPSAPAAEADDEGGFIGGLKRLFGGDSD